MRTVNRIWPPVLNALGGVGLVAWAGYAFGTTEPWGHTSVGVALAWTLLAVLPMYAVGVFLYLHSRDHPGARLVMLTGACGAIGIGVEGVVGHAYRAFGPGAWLLPVNLGYQYIGVVSACAGTALFAYFPDGRPGRRGHAVAVRTACGLMLAAPLFALFVSPSVPIDRYLLDPAPVVQNPVALPWLAPLSGVALVYNAFYALVLVGVVVLLVRHRRASGAERRLMRVLVTTLLVFLPVAVFDAVSSALGAPANPVVGFLYMGVVLVLAGTIVAGILRHGLFDVELVARRAAVYGALTLAIAAVYVVIVAVPGLALGRLVPVELAVLITIAAALAFHPLRRRLDALADRWAFGPRTDNARLLMDLGATLERSVDLRELLPRVARTVRDGLDAAWVRVSLRDEDGAWLAEPAGWAGLPATASGRAELTVELERAGERVGRIDCGPKPSGGYSAREHELLDRLAGQAATAIANVRLTAQLASSRARIVAAADVERRRIERDIHDGVQQEVVAMLTTLRLGRNQVARGERPPDDVLAEAAALARDLLTELRELAHGIHPPVLSDRGLVAAVQGKLDRLPMHADLHVDPGVDGHRFGQQVEGAAYFVACEALTNVVKHADARHARVRLGIDEGRLHVEVSDDGAGSRNNGTAGHGVTNMRDRVEALGGRLAVEHGATGGTVVRAELPLPAAEPAPAGALPHQEQPVTELARSPFDTAPRGTAATSVSEERS